ncbi:PrsW family intramembrane metalloprotease [Leptolyngbya sp. AN02str]|uniref:PrsW family intramembrane metalloprotease n=1 Tax=Leptolyngbya sp. AN02str TaxID=3423363 RepID=UPI003D317B94
MAIPINTVILNSLGDFVALHPDIKAVLGKDAGMLLGAPIAGPLVEETTKALGALLLFWLFHSEFDNVRDGFIFGALIDIGFNLQETPLYIARGFDSAGDIPLYHEIASRFAVFGFEGHALFTGMFGMGLGLARQTTRRWLRVAAPIGGWLLGFSAHFLTNITGLVIALVIYFQTGQPMVDTSATATIAPAVVTPFLNQWGQQTFTRLMTLFPFFLIAGVMLCQSGIWERNVIREQLADEQEPVITPDEYEAVKGDRLFRTRRIAGYTRRTSTAIVKAQDELAFRKWRLKQQEQDVDTDPLVAFWRDVLSHLRERKEAIAA